MEMNPIQINQSHTNQSYVNESCDFPLSGDVVEWKATAIGKGRAKVWSMLHSIYYCHLIVVSPVTLSHSQHSLYQHTIPSQHTLYQHTLPSQHPLSTPPLPTYPPLSTHSRYFVCWKITFCSPTKVH